MHLPETALSRTIDRFVCWVGEFASLLWTALMLVIVVQVVARYAFGYSRTDDSPIRVILGLSFTEVKERYVRIDVLAGTSPPRTRPRIQLFGLAALLLPFTLVVIWFAIPFFWSSFTLNEVSAAPGGLPYRWVLKSFIVSAFALLALVALGRLTRVLAALTAQRAAARH